MNTEYSGNIYADDEGNFSFTRGRTGNADSSPFKPTLVPDGTVYSGSYHTHGAFDVQYDSEQFSPIGCNGGQLCDIGIALSPDNQGQPMFLGTPAGRTEVFYPGQFADFPFGCVLIGPAVVADPGHGTSSVPVPTC